MSSEQKTHDDLEGPEFFDDEEEDDEPIYGQPGSMENPDIHIKWICDGLTSLQDVAAALRDYANHVTSLATDGWRLSEPVDNSHGYVDWVGEGSPPPRS